MQYILIISFVNFFWETICIYLFFYFLWKYICTCCKQFNNVKLSVEQNFQHSRICKVDRLYGYVESHIAVAIGRIAKVKVWSSTFILEGSRNGAHWWNGRHWRHKGCVWRRGSSGWRTVQPSQRDQAATLADRRIKKVDIAKEHRKRLKLIYNQTEETQKQQILILLLINKTSFLLFVA